MEKIRTCDRSRTLPREGVVYKVDNEGVHFLDEHGCRNYELLENVELVPPAERRELIPTGPGCMITREPDELEI